MAVVRSSAQFYSFGLPVGDSLIVGFKFEVSGSEHYGWMRYNHSITGPIESNITLLDYAYNDCPLAPIVAGDTVANAGPCPSVEDIEVVNLMEYTRKPLVQIDGSESEIVISNNGDIGTNDIMLISNIYKNPDFTTPFQTDTLSGITLDSLSSGSFSAVQFQPDSAEFYVFEHYISSDSINDIIPNNDTLVYSLLVNETFARDNNSLNSSFGMSLSSGSSGTIGTNYTLGVDGVVDSVNLVILSDEMDGQPLSASIYATDVTGKPDTSQILFHTDTITYDTAVGVVFTSLPIHGGPKELTAGTYFVGVHQNVNTLGIGTASSIYTPRTNWVRFTGGDFDPSESYGAAFEDSYLLRLNFTDCLPTYDSTDVSLEPGTSIVVNGLPVSEAGYYNDVFKNVDGCDSIIVYNVEMANSIASKKANTSVYPNPTNDLLNISSQKSNINTVRILDIQGRELDAIREVNTNSTTLDISSYEDGVYFLKVELMNGEAEIRKIVKTEK